MILIHNNISVLKMLKSAPFHLLYYINYIETIFKLHLHLKNLISPWIICRVYLKCQPLIPFVT
jgi:hypothetical protein